MLTMSCRSLSSQSNTQSFLRLLVLLNLKVYFCMAHLVQAKRYWLGQLHTTRTAHLFVSPDRS